MLYIEAKIMEQLMLDKISGSIVGGGVVSAAKGVANIIDQFVETEDEKRAAECCCRSWASAPCARQRISPAGHRSASCRE